MSASEALNPQQFSDEGPHSFDVEVSDHDALRQGKTALHIKGSQHTHHRIVIGGGLGLDEAHLVAAQMAALHGMPTAVHTRI